MGINPVYVIVDFICKGYLELIGTRVERELQNEKWLPTVGFEPGIFCLRSECATTELRGQVSVSPGFTHAIFRHLPAAPGRCSKTIYHELHFVNSLK